MEKEKINKLLSVLKDCDYTSINIDRHSVIKLIKDGGCFKHIADSELDKLNDVLMYDYELVLREINISEDIGDRNAISASIIVSLKRKN